MNGMEHGQRLPFELQPPETVLHHMGKGNEFSSPRFEPIHGYGMGTIPPGGTPVVVA